MTLDSVVIRVYWLIFDVVDGHDSNLYMDHVSPLLTKCKCVICCLFSVPHRFIWSNSKPENRSKSSNSPPAPVPQCTVARLVSGRCKIYNSKNTKNHAFKAILLAKYMPVMTDEMLRADAVKDLLYEYIYGKVPCIL